MSLEVERQVCRSSLTQCCGACKSCELRLVTLQAQVEQWIDFSTISIDAPVQSWVYPLLMPQAFPYDKKVRSCRGICFMRRLNLACAFQPSSSSGLPKGARYVSCSAPNPTIYLVKVRLHDAIQRKATAKFCKSHIQ